MAQTHNSKAVQRKMIQDKLQDRYDNLFSGKEELPTDMSIRQVEALKAHVAELESHVAELESHVAELEVQPGSNDFSSSQSSTAKSSLVDDLAVQVQETRQDEISDHGDLRRQSSEAELALDRMAPGSWIGTLEQAERAHYLQLASEVSRAVSERMADLYSLLKDAVELIREKFNLYYTQIYLLNSTGHTLVLRAGTGEVGKQLIERRHQLLVNSMSLNGRAANERKAMVVSNTAQSIDFLPNPLLPNTRSEMAVPLLASGQVVGVLDMQSDEPDTLSEVYLPAFETLAGQLAITIQNAALFAEVEQARSEVEAQVHRLTEKGWQDFLDGIERGEKIGFVFNQGKVAPLTAEAFTAELDDVLNVPVLVTGTKVGAIQLKNEPGHKWTSSETELIQVISAQLSQHIENRRLLAQAERYREQAEQVARRLTREGWKIRQTRSNVASGYVYDLNKVEELLGELNDNSADALKQPLLVRDEIIGELSVNTATREDEASEIVAAVAQQLSGHIENLRLTEQTELALRNSMEAEKVVREGEAKLSEALEIAKLANWEYDVERDRFLFNDHFYSIFHTNVKEMGGYELSSAEYAQRLVYPEDLPVVGAAIEKALASTDKHYNTQLEHRIRYSDGEMGYISVEIHIDRDDQGKITRYYGANQDITERKLAEQEVRESEAKLSEALEIAKLANWEYDVERDRFLFNDHFYSIFHTNVKEMGGYELSSAEYAQRLVYPEDLPVVGAAIEKGAGLHRQALQHSSWSTALHMQMAVMGYISVDIHIDRDDQGKITRYYGANQDITERKLAEQAVRESEAKLSEALEIAKLANWEYDVERDRFLFNDHFYSIFHTNVKEMGGYELSSAEYAQRLVYPEDLPVVGAAIEKALASTDKHYNTQLEHRIRYSDGEMGYISVEIHIDRDDQGKITRYYGANQDITERKLAEQIVAKRAAELQTVAEVSATTARTLEPDRLLQAVVDITKERFDVYHAHIYLADESWNTLLLAAGAGEIGRQMVATGHSIRMDTEKSLVARAARERQAVIVNDVRDDPAFLPNPLLPETRSEMAVPMIVGDKVLGVFDVQSNITNHFTEEDAYIYTTLASQVAVALQNARLYTEQAATVTQLRELDRLKTSFLANMSHELRTPLNSILGFSDVIIEGLDGPVTEQMDNDLRLIGKNGQHLLHLINDVLDMAKIDAGRMNLQPEKFKLNGLFEEAINITSSLADAKSLSVVIKGILIRRWKYLPIEPASSR